MVFVEKFIAIQLTIKVLGLWDLKVPNTGPNPDPVKSSP
jgi:hypothetical protein